MKKIILICAILSVCFLVGCSNENRENIINNNGNSIEENNELDEKDELLDTSKAEKVVSIYMNSRDVWEDKEFMDSTGISGIYALGYGFFDIDNDGEKELAVQYGGGTLHNCITRFYKLVNESINEVKYFSEEQSLSIEDLTKYEDEEGNEFYINIYTLRIDSIEYITFTDKIVASGDKLESNNLFRIEEKFISEGVSDKTYYIYDESVDEEAYVKAYDYYFDKLNEILIGNEIITYNDWKEMTEAEQEEALKESLIK